MRIFSLSLLLMLGLFSACTKKDLTQTRVGFYILKTSPPGPHDQEAYELYIDGQYKGMLQVSAVEPSDTSLMRMETLDAERHIIQVKNVNQLLSSTYVQIGERKTACGTWSMIQAGPNGSYFNKPNNRSYATYGIYQ